MSDIRFALRSFGRSPGLTTAIVLTLALGIGANTAVFSVLDAALFKPLPVNDPERLAEITAYRGTRPRALSYPVFRDLTAHQQVMSELSASGSADFESVRLAGAFEELDDVDGGMVSANYFTMLGVNAAIGRVFTAADSPSPGEGAVAVIGDGFWARQFGRDPSVIGRTVVLNRTPFTIIGVAPPGFFGDRVGTVRDIWVPILMQPRLAARSMLDVRTASWFSTIGRLRDGVTEERANADMTALFQRLMGDEIAAGSGSLVNAGQATDYRIQIARGSGGLNRLRPFFQRPLTLLAAVVALVLLIACGNVANLLLARGAARGPEIGIRLAMGSSRGRLVRQLLTESALLAAAGGTLGLLLAYWTRNVLAAQVPLGEFVVSLDLRVLAFALALSAITTLIFGSVPAARAISPVIASARVRPRQRLARTLVVGQIALSLCVLTGAGLLARTLENLRQVDIGVDRTEILAVELRVEEDTVPPAEMPGLRTRLSERLKTVPGISQVAFSAYGLFLGSMQTAPVRVPGSSVDPSNDPDVRQNYVSSEYFQTLGMTLLAGRGFVERDLASNAPVTVINESMARHYFGDDNPIGRIIYFPGSDEQGRYLPFTESLSSSIGVEVVGVVRDARYDDLRAPTSPMAFLPMPQDIDETGLVYLRMSAAPDDLAAAIQRAVSAVSPSTSVRRIATLEDHIDTTLAQEHLLTRLLSVFGGIALFLTCLGIYGVMAYAVRRRTGEIGIRMALGARQTDVVSMVLRDTMRLSASGVVFGILAALVSTRLLTGFLFGITPTDPATVATVAALMLSVAGLSGLMPARRAARVDPVIALRTE